MRVEREVRISYDVRTETPVIEYGPVHREAHAPKPDTDRITVPYGARVTLHLRNEIPLDAIPGPEGFQHALNINGAYGLSLHVSGEQREASATFLAQHPGCYEMECCGRKMTLAVEGA